MSSVLQYLDEATFLVLVVVFAAGVAGWAYARRNTGKSASDAMWLIILAGFIVSSLVRVIGIARYPDHAHIFKDMDNTLAMITGTVAFAWVFGAILATHPKIKRILPTDTAG